MKAFINSQFGYCLLVWMNHSRKLNNRINRIHERALRVVYNDENSTFDELVHNKNTEKNIMNTKKKCYIFILLLFAFFDYFIYYFQFIVLYVEARNSRIPKSIYAKWRHTLSYQFKNFYRNSSSELVAQLHKILN